MNFLTIKGESVADYGETLQSMIANKQRRADLNLGASANEAQVVYAPIGQLVVKEVEEYPKPIKVGDVYRNQNGQECRIVVVDRKGVRPIIGLVSSHDEENMQSFFEDGKRYGQLPSEEDLVIPRTSRKMVTFVPATVHDVASLGNQSGEHPIF